MVLDNSDSVSGKRIALAAAIAIAAHTPTDAPAQTPDPRNANALDAVSVTATRTETNVRDVPGTVTVITADELERRGAQSIRDATRYEPGVTVGNQPARSGRSSYVIRGIGQNRVLITVDGVRVPDFPANAQPGTFTRDYLDLESIKRLEIVRGPASSLYGSDAIGGVVAYVTKDPADYLAQSGRDWFASGKLAYDSANNGFAETATFAGRSGAFETLFVGTRRDGEEYETTGRIGPNPQITQGHNVLGKLVWNLDANSRLRLTTELFDASTHTNIRSELGAVVGAPGTTVDDSRGEDFTRRRRLALDYVRNAPIGFVDRMTAIVSYAEVDKNDESFQRRTVGASKRLRLTDQSFSQDIIGLDLQLETKREALGARHKLVYGFNADFAQTSRSRDRTEFNLTTGTATKTIAGETFPSKVFPDTDTVLAGIYLQDTITWSDAARFTLIPGIRVDHYRMTPNPDREFTINNPGAVSDVSATAISPKLGAVYKVSDVYSVFGQYARGFRSPPYDDANIGFRNSTFGYEVLPNANLQPETSDGFEAGLRGRFAGGSSFSVSAFYNFYQDFIEQKQIGTSGGLIQFQSRNIPRVTIWGLEARGEYRLDDRWSLHGAAAYARGTDRSDGLPLDAVDPLRAVAGIRYDAPSNWGVEFVGAGATRKHRVSQDSYFQSPAYAVFDLLGYYDFGSNVTLRAGVLNLLNKKYWVSQDVVGVASTSALKDLYAASGTTVGASIVVRW